MPLSIELTARLEDAMRTLGRELATIDFLALPSVPVDREDFARALPPATSAIYFIVHNKRDKRELKYIGKASNLRSRWQFTGKSFFHREPCDVHHCLPEALELGNVTLHYWEIPKAYISIVELLLLRELAPPWNCHDVNRD